MKKFYKRRQFYIEPNLQFKYALLSLFFTFFNLCIICVGIFLTLEISNTVTSYLENRLIFFGGIILTFLIVIFLTFFLSILFSHRVAGPLYRFSQKMKEVKKGIIKPVILRKNDELTNLEIDFNEMLYGIENLIKKDRQKIQEILQALNILEEYISKIENSELKSNLSGIKQKLLELTKNFILTEDDHRENPFLH